MLLYLASQINIQFALDSEITLLNSILNIYLLRNHFEAFYQISKIQNQTSLSIQDDLIIHKLKQKAESYVSKNSTLFNTDIDEMVESHNNFQNFIDQVELTTKNMVFFWKGLLPDNPSFDQLNEISGKIADDNESLKYQFDTMFVTPVQKTQTTLVYVGYLNRVMNRSERSPEIKELLNKVKIRTLKKMNKHTFLTSNKLQDGETAENSEFLNQENFSLGIDFVEESHNLNKKGIVICGGEQHNLGKIINLNEQMFAMFGFKAEDLQKQSINELMPRQFAVHHDKIIRLYLQRGGRNSIFDQGPRQIWVKNRYGYLDECKLDVRVVPDLMNGIKIMGVIYKTRLTEKQEEEDSQNAGGNSASQKSLIQKYGTQADGGMGSKQNFNMNTEIENSLDGKITQKVVY